MRQTRRTSPSDRSAASHASLSIRSLLERKDDTYRKRPEEATQYSTLHRSSARVEADKRMTWASKTPHCPLGGLSQARHHRSRTEQVNSLTASPICICMHIPREACGRARWGKWSSGLHSPDTSRLGFAHSKRKTRRLELCLGRWLHFDHQYSCYFLDAHLDTAAPLSQRLFCTACHRLIHLAMRTNPDRQAVLGCHTEIIMQRLPGWNESSCNKASRMLLEGRSSRPVSQPRDY